MKGFSHWLCPFRNILLKNFYLLNFLLELCDLRKGKKKKMMKKKYIKQMGLSTE